MPRGNDAAAARRDLDTQYGGNANAEDLIEAHDANHDAELQRALSKPVDQEATNKLDLDKIDPDIKGSTVLAAAVRAGQLVVVEETKDGVLHKSLDASYSGAGSRRNPAARPDDGADDDDDTDAAPESVSVPKIKEKLDELQITVPSDVRTKAALWALVPEEGRAELVAAN